MFRCVPYKFIKHIYEGGVSPLQSEDGELTSDTNHLGFSSQTFPRPRLKCHLFELFVIE